VGSSLLALPLAIASAGDLLILMACVVALLSGLSIRQKIEEMVTAGFVAAGLSYAFGTLLQTVFGLQGGHE
jgi:VIT1/CCC1 family predicted Fe2+/Mn2+ transporter